MGDGSSAPRRPLSSLRLFVLDNLATVRTKYPSKSRVDAEAFLVRMWRSGLLEEDKAPYVKVARELRVRWRQQCVTWQRRRRGPDGKARRGRSDVEAMAGGAAKDDATERLLSDEGLRGMTLPPIDDAESCRCIRCRVRDAMLIINAPPADLHAASKTEARDREELSKRDLARRLEVREAGLTRMEVDAASAPNFNELRVLKEDLSELMRSARHLMGSQRGAEALYAPP